MWPHVTLPSLSCFHYFFSIPISLNIFWNGFFTTCFLAFFVMFIFCVVCVNRYSSPVANYSPFSSTRSSMAARALRRQGPQLDDNSHAQMFSNTSDTWLGVWDVLLKLLHTCAEWFRSIAWYCEMTLGYVGGWGGSLCLSMDDRGLKLPEMAQHQGPQLQHYVTRHSP